MPYPSFSETVSAGGNLDTATKQGDRINNFLFNFLVLGKKDCAWVSGTFFLFHIHRI